MKRSIAQGGKAATRKLGLSRETVKQLGTLGDLELRRVAGGGLTDGADSECLGPICPEYMP
jgi:hypothetical protein